MKIDVSQCMDYYENFMSDAGRAIVDGYQKANENNFGDVVRRIVSSLGENEEHAQRLANYLGYCGKDRSFGNAILALPTPVWQYTGNKEHGVGHMSSCFLMSIDMNTIHTDTFKERLAMINSCSSRGGGIGLYIKNVPPVENGSIVDLCNTIGSSIKLFTKVGVRSSAITLYFRYDNPQIDYLLKMKQPTGGSKRDTFLYTKEVHIGIILDDEFTRKCDNLEMVDLKYNGKVYDTISADKLLFNIVESRCETGNPFILNVDRGNEFRPQVIKKLGLKVETSNLCTEIIQPISTPNNEIFRENDLISVCILSSINVDGVYFMAKDMGISFKELFEQVVYDLSLLLDNMVTQFVEDIRKEENSFLELAAYTLESLRSVGLGISGLHSYFQRKELVIGSEKCKEENNKIFELLNKYGMKANKRLAEERGPAPFAKLVGENVRFTYHTMCCPTATSSKYTNGSEGIECMYANTYVQKFSKGHFVYKNPILVEKLQKLGLNTPKVWSSIREQEGSIQHLSCISQTIKDVYRTSNEIDQQHIIDMCAQRNQYLDQGQSTTLTYSNDVSVGKLGRHLLSGIKHLITLYYMRTTAPKSIQASISQYQEEEKGRKVEIECESCVV